MEHPWVCRASVAQVGAIAVVFGVAMWALIAGMDLVAIRYQGAATVPMATLDSVVGLVRGLLLFKLLLSQRGDYRRMEARLRAIADVNHHIRNALDRIELTAHVTHNQQLIADIGGGVQRIEWALKEVLPAVKEDEEVDE